jgi:hypothetical protein
MLSQLRNVLAITEQSGAEFSIRQNSQSCRARHNMRPKAKKNTPLQKLAGQNGSGTRQDTGNHVEPMLPVL